MERCNRLRWMGPVVAAYLLFAAFPVAAQAPAAPPSAPAPQQWPQEYLKNGNRLVIYQPQLDDWNNYRVLTADTAVSVTPAGGQPVMGVVSWSATTLTDTQTRTVVIKDFVVKQARFPSLDAATAASTEKLARDTYTSTAMTISLDRLLAGFKSVQAPTPTAIRTEPPPIYFSTTPAVVVFIDGDPIRVPIDGTSLSYLVNTTWDLLYDSSNYYLLTEAGWLKARALAGPWTVTADLPAEFSKIPATDNWQNVRQAIPAPKPGKAVPRVIVADKPAELLLFQGKPAYTKIAGTSLSYASNTDDDVFLDRRDQQVYVLLSGRWFRAASLNGPWTYAGNDLPADFGKIPPGHPAAHVLVSVPGTQQAHDAVMLAQVPTTVIVNRAEAEAKVKVAYAGEPQFKPIAGTTLSYATNTQDKVIKFGDLYYLCFQGIWFVSASPNGPWKTADSVPKEIYGIPPASPVYNVTYVTVTNPTETTVESNSTAGYMGMFVLGATMGACIAYGTGYYYAPYYWWGPHPWPIYYPYPYTYGFHAVYNPATGFYGIGGAVYGPYGAAGRAAWYNPATGNYGRAASVQTAWGGRTAAQVYNPWTGNWGSTHQGHNPYAQWGSSVINQGGDITHTWHVATDNNIYAGKDGNVYRRDANGNWSKYNDGNWTPVNPPPKGQDRKSGGDASNYKGRTDRQQGTTPALDRQQGTAANADRQQQLDGVRQQSAERQRTREVQPAAERTTGQFNVPQGSRGASVSSATMQGLNRDASARQAGAARERSFNRGSMGAGRSMGRRR